VERWPELSIDPNANRYVATVLNNYSRFVRVSAVNVGGATYDSGLEYYTTVSALTGGADGTIADADYTDALTNLDVIEGTLLLNAVGQTNSTIVSQYITKAAARGDSFVIIDPSLTDIDATQIAATAANFSGLSNGGYAAHFAPALEMVDPAKTGPGAIRTTYPGGAVAGLFVRTEVERSVAKSPAGYAADIRGALGLTVKLSDAQIGVLYDGSPQVNSFTDHAPCRR
jgi:phage tail sheath protein FI